MRDDIISKHTTRASVIDTAEASQFSAAANATPSLLRHLARGYDEEVHAMRERYREIEWLRGSSR